MTPETRLGVRDDAHEGCHTLSLTGELDVVTAPILEAALETLSQQGAREIVLDLHELSFIDSSGLRLILAGKQLCERHNCEFALTRPRPVAQHLFEMTGVLERLSFRARALADGLRRRPASAGDAPVDRARPDFETSLDLNLHAPRAARTFVGDLLRDAACERVREVAMLLTSELVTPIVQQGAAVFLEAGELRVWLGPGPVRVELCVPGELLSPVPELLAPHARQILAGLADRWAVETAGSMAQIWFEVEPHRSDEEAERAAVPLTDQAARSN